jgi:peptidoglycan/LPS O-acetylase OafA/YrhL
MLLKAPTTVPMTTAARWGGIDLLRVLGAGLVFTTHVLSLTNHDQLAQILGWQVGRLGTMTFLVVAGYMASATARSPEVWLGRRVATLMPPYWIILAFSFVAVRLTGYKTFSIWQIVAQFLGIGAFTHPGRLVLVVTWFISVVMVLYLVVYGALRLRSTRVILFALIAMLVGGCCNNLPQLGWLHAGSVFLAAYLLPHDPRKLPLPALLAAAGYLVAGYMLPSGDLRHAGAALFAFALLAPWRGACAPLAVLARHSYFVYLVHGPMLHLALKFTGGSLLPTAILGALLTVPAAVLLKQLSDPLTAAWLDRVDHSGKRPKPPDDSLGSQEARLLARTNATLVNTAGRG